MKKPRIVTHNGSFHTDDCFAVATLLIFLKLEPKDVDIVRTRDQKLIETSDYVLDVGNIYDPDNNRFDHHQAGGAGARANGIPYAAFGLVWKKYGKEICGSENISVVLDKNLVQPCDAMDNGTDLYKPSSEGMPEPYTIDDCVLSFLPSWKNEKTADGTFIDAVNFAKALLIREIDTARDDEEGAIQVEKSYKEVSDKRIIILDKEYDWQEPLAKYPDPLLVIYPQGGNYHVKAVKAGPSTFRTKVMFPEGWAGKRDGELARVTGVGDSIFCHNQRFLAVAKSKVGAIALAKKALDSI